MEECAELNICNVTKLNETEVPALYDRPETYIVPVLFAAIFVIGCLGNGTLILIFILHKNMRNVPNTYIFSLALGDLLVILTSVPFSSIIYTVDSWPFGTAICKISETAKDVSIGVSVFTLTALSADRFFAIVDPMRKLHTSGGGRGATRCTILEVALIWLVAILLAVPAGVFSYLLIISAPQGEIYICYPFPEHMQPWYPKTVVIVRFVVYYALPLIVIGIFYCLMARHLFLSTRNLPGESARQVHARKKVAKMVLAFVFIFAVCFLPQHVFYLWFYFNPNSDEDYNDIWHAIRITSLCLAYLNSCVNPAALFCVSGKFRKHFRHYLYCCLGQHLSRSQSVSMTSTRRLGTIKTSIRKFDSRSQSTYQGKGGQHLLVPEVTITTFINGVPNNQQPQN